MERVLSNTFQALAVLVPFGLIVWLNDRAGVDTFRLGFAGVIVFIAAIYLWQTWQRLWAPLFVVLLAGVGLALVFLTSPDASIRWFEEFAAKALAWYFHAALAWLYMRLALPKALAKYQATGILILGGILSTVLLVIAATWWLSAVDLYALPKNPVVTTGTELKTQWEAGYGNRPRGVFAVGTIGDAAKRSESPTTHSDFLAYYSRGEPGGLFSSRPENFLPIQYNLTLSDGTIVGVQGIHTVRDAANWPEGGPHLWQQCLRPGDPVVIWADPGETTSVSSGQSSGALNFPRVIAYGTLDDFYGGYLARTVKTARVFGWIGFALIPLSLIPAVLGLMRWNWLRHHGSDAAPPRGTKTIRQQLKDQP